ncbi:hypothetical protein D3C86_1666790 [compost metagenome]
MIQSLRIFQSLNHFVIFQISLKAFRNVESSVQSDQISQFESSGFWTIQQIASQGIRFFNGQTDFLSQFHNFRHRINADSVSDKSWSVFTKNSGFSKEFLAVRHKEINDRFIRFRTWNHFKQFQISWRIEEVCSTKMFLEIFRPSFRHQMNRDSRCVRSNQSS